MESVKAKTSSSLQADKANHIRNSMVLEGSRIGIWDWNIQTGETYFNEYWAKIIGYSIEELRPTTINTWMQFAHPDDLEQSNQLLEQHFRGETEYYEFASRMKHKDGHWVWVLDRGKVFEWDEEGKPLRMCGSHTDVTEIKAKEKALLEANEKLEKIFDIIDVGVSITDESGSIIDCNTASERMLGITKEEHINRNYAGKEWKIIKRNFTEMSSDEYASVRAMKENRTIENVEMGVFKNDEEITWLSVNASPLNIDGYGVLITYSDITKQISTQEELKSANRTKDKFFSIIAHDLKSPLTGIQGLAELATLSLSENDHAEANTYLNTIQESTLKGAELISDILEWAKIQSNEIDYSPKKIKLSDNIQHNISLLLSSLKDKSLKITVEQEDNVFVKADSYMLDAIIRNLLANAIKFSNRGGEIKIKVTSKNSIVQTAISDEGIGIPEETLNHIFTTKKIDSRDGTNGESGTGLGLLLCKEFVEVQGGEITLKSKVGKGSTFYFTLPQVHERDDHN